MQSELDQAGNALPQLTNPTPEQWLERATQLVTQAIANKKKLQTANNALIAKAPNALEKQKATYNADLLVDEIASLQARLDKLNAETARRKEIARQAAIRAANTYAMPANGSVVATAAGRGLIQVAQGAASLAQAISDAIAVLGRVLASAPSVMAVGFASLTYSSRTAEQWQDQTPDSVVTPWAWMPLNWGFPKRKPERGCKSQRYRRSADAPDQRGTRQHDDPFGGQHRWCERSESRSGPDGGLQCHDRPVRGYGSLYDRRSAATDPDLDAGESSRKPEPFEYHSGRTEAGAGAGI